MTPGALCAAHRAQEDRWLYAPPATVTACVNARVGILLVQIGQPDPVAALARRGRVWRDLVREQTALVRDACAAGRGCSDTA